MTQNSQHSDAQAEQLPEPEETGATGAAAIKDPGEYALRRRLEQILNARDTVREVRKEARRKGLKNAAYRLQSATHAYALEVESLLRDADLDTEWPEKVPWNSYDEYLDVLGQSIEKYPRAPGKDPEYTTASSAESLAVYRYLNSTMADIGLDARLDDGREKSRY